MQLITNSVKKVIRVKKQDSAYLYSILESYDGLVNFSTLDKYDTDIANSIHVSAEPQTEKTPELRNYRDIELRFTSDFIEEMQELLVELRGLIYEVKK